MSDTPKTDALVRRHQAASKAMTDSGYSFDDYCMREHAHKQAQELLDHAMKMERTATSLCHLCDDALEFIQNYEDTKDYGEGRQGPNRAMSLCQDLRAAIAKVRAM